MWIRALTTACRSSGLLRFARRHILRLRKYLYICSVEMQLEVNSQNGLGATMESLTVGLAVACLFGMDSRGGGDETRRGLRAQHSSFSAGYKILYCFFFLGIGLPDWVGRCPFLHSGNTEWHEIRSGEA